jgi:hypothetical protein
MKLNSKKAKFALIFTSVSDGEGLSFEERIKQVIIDVIKKAPFPITLISIAFSMLVSAQILISDEVIEKYLEEDEDFKSVCRYKKKSGIVIPLK